MSGDHGDHGGTTNVSSHRRLLGLLAPFSGSELSPQFDVLCPASKGSHSHLVASYDAYDMNLEMSREL